MDAMRDHPPASLVRRVLRWLGDFEQAMDMRPVDLLEARLVRLERQLATRLGDDAETGAPDAPRPHQSAVEI